MAQVAGEHFPSFSPQHAADERQDDESDRHPEEDPRPFRGNPGDASESEESRNERDDQKYDCPVEKIAHESSRILEARFPVVQNNGGIHR